MSHLSLADMYSAVYNTVEFVLGFHNLEIVGGYQNVSAPEDTDYDGNPENPYIMIRPIPSGGSQGRADSKFILDDPEDPENPDGYMQYREDFVGAYEIHQIGGVGEYLQEFRLALETAALGETGEYMRQLGLSSRTVSDITPTYNRTDKNWGPDCMAEFTFAGSFVRIERAIAITDVEFDVNNQ